MAEFDEHPAPVAVPVGVGELVGVEDADCDADKVGCGGAGVSVSCGVGDGMRKHPLRIIVALLAITANRARETSRLDMPQS
jgi:hypothetical protein